MPNAILVPMTGASGDAAALAAAFLVGGADAHMDALFVRPDPRDAVPLFGEGMTGTLVDDIMRAAESDGVRHAGAARAVFERAVAAAGATVAERPGAGGVTASFRAMVGRIEEVVPRAARVRDLAVFSRSAATSDVEQQVAMEAALLSGGRPVLLAPDAAPSSIGRAVAVAWNGSRESARAVSSAMPILAKAAKVVVLTAETSETRADAAGGLTEYLAWHGLAAEARTFKASGAVGAAIMDAAKAAGADLLVMGGYGHSRVREMVLGGVTRWMVENGGLPVLMAH
jgi:nucleotide-binding universal stress UspA family protein